MGSIFVVEVEFCGRICVVPCSFGEVVNDGAEPVFALEICVVQVRGAVYAR